MGSCAGVAGRVYTGRMQILSLNINGKLRHVEVDPATPLLYVLRNHLYLMGAKLGCGLEQCGACAVLVDGEATQTCAAAAADFIDRKIVTVEGLANENGLSDVQQAFVEMGAAQCGYCIPGLIIAVTALLNGDPRPDRTTITAALSPHLCRCGSHGRVLAAVESLVTERAGDAENPQP